MASEIHTAGAKITNSSLPPYYLIDGLPWINISDIQSAQFSQIANSTLVDAEYRCRILFLVVCQLSVCQSDTLLHLYYLMVGTKFNIYIFWKHLVQADQHIFLLFLLHSKIKPSIRVLYCFCFLLIKSEFLQHPIVVHT